MRAETISISGRADAIGPSANPGGSIALASCTLDVESGAQVRTAGAGATNVLQASGQMTVAGSLVSEPATSPMPGKNRLEYRNASQPPSLTGATITPAPEIVLNTQLPACGTGAICGNGVLEPGAQCDE